MIDDLQHPCPERRQSARTISVLTTTEVELLQATTNTTAEQVPLLFGLSLAVVLPPEALIAPHGPAEPDVQAVPPAVSGAEAVAAILRRPTIAVSAGQVRLDEVDRRLAGLVVRLNVYRVADAPAALVSTGLVSALPSSATGRSPTYGFQTTPRELWTLARETLVQLGKVCKPMPGLGDDAFLTLRGDRTAQVAWLTDEGLATVGVTSLQAEKGWVIAAARSIAEHGGREAIGLGTSLEPHEE